MIKRFAEEIHASKNSDGDGVCVFGNDGEQYGIKKVRVKADSDKHPFGGTYELSFTFDTQLSFLCDRGELTVSCFGYDDWYISDMKRVLIEMVPGHLSRGPVLKATVRFDELASFNPPEGEEGHSNEN